MFCKKTDTRHTRHQRPTKIDGSDGCQFCCIFFKKKKKNILYI